MEMSIGSASFPEQSANGSIEWNKLENVRFCIVVVVACCLVMTATAAEIGRLDGRVVSDPAGAPLRRWTIDLFGVTDPDYRQTTDSGLDGSFSFAGVPAGKYRVMDDNLVVPYLSPHGEA